MTGQEWSRLGRESWRAQLFAEIDHEARERDGHWRRDKGEGRTELSPVCADCKRDRWAVFNVRGEWYCVDCYAAAVERARTENAVSRRVS